MNREYDLFERLPDGSPLWRGHASGLEELTAKLREIAKKTENECFAIHLPTMDVVGRANVGASPRYD